MKTFIEWLERRVRVDEVVSRDKKMYRRAMAAFKGKTHDFHATSGAGQLGGVLDAGAVVPKTRGHRAPAPGSGIPDAYFGRGWPAGPWFDREKRGAGIGGYAVGVPHDHMDKLSFEEKPEIGPFSDEFTKPRTIPADPHSLRDYAPYNPYHWVQSLGDVPLTPKSFVVAPEDELKNFSSQMRKRRLRPMSYRALDAAAKKFPASGGWPD
jgi:hypothetical protein